MKTPEERAALMREQIQVKVNWGAKDWEILSWLEEKHALTGAEAQALLDEAKRQRKMPNRLGSLLMFSVSAGGLFALVTYIFLQLRSGAALLDFVIVGPFGFSLICLGFLINSIQRFLVGRSEEPKK